MSDYNNCAAALLDPAQRLDQFFFALVVKIGIWLIQYEQFRVAEYGARHADALSLAAGEHAARASDYGVIALWQAQDHLVDTRETGGRHNFFRVCLLKAADVVGNSAIEQFNVLGQVADMRPQLTAVPAGDIGPVQSYLAGIGGPDAHKSAGQR